MKTWTVRSVQDIGYRIHQTDGVFESRNPLLAALAGIGPGSRHLVVVDRIVDGLHGRGLRQYFDAHGASAHVVVLDASEAAKSPESVLAVARAADEAGIRRRSDPILAVGGGVITDVVGMAASVYRRGTPFVRVPTTLVGLVDAAIGAKTGVNYNGHKNRLGTYFPATDSILDRAFLRTLPQRHVRNGLAEIVKIATMKDDRLFRLLELDSDRLVDQHVGTANGQEILERSVTAMLGELEPNLWEHQLKRAADFGHTFSPALEMTVGEQLLHGEAVAVDMALSSALAHERGLLGEEQLQRILRLFDRLRLPSRHAACTLDLLERALVDTVRHRDGHQHLPLPSGIGDSCFVEDVSTAELERALAFVNSRELEMAVR